MIQESEKNEFVLGALHEGGLSKWLHEVKTHNVGSILDMGTHKSPL